MASAQALAAYSTITRQYADLALSQPAHVGKALMLYELGQRPEGISELKTVEARLRGYAEVIHCKDQVAQSFSADLLQALA